MAVVQPRVILHARPAAPTERRYGLCIAGEKVSLRFRGGVPGPQRSDGRPAISMIGVASSPIEFFHQNRG